MKEKGFTFIILIIIVIIGVVIGVVVYTVQTKSVPAIETAKPTTQASPANSEAPSVKANFSKEGAFFARDDGWTFLWDEPGRLALNVKVKFTDQSVCLLGGEKKDCALINMGPKSYDRVSLEGERNGDEVTATKLEEVKMPQ